MFQDRPLALEIEVRMVGEVDDRIFVGHGAIVDPQLVARQAIIDKCFEISGIPLLAILAEIRQVQNVAVGRGGPNAFVEACETTVKMVAVVVPRKLILDTVEREATISDAVRVTSNQRAEVARVVDVIFERVKTEDDVFESTTAIRRPQRGDGAAVRDDGHLEAALVTESVRKDLGARRRAKVCFVDRHSLLNTRLASSRVSIEPTSNHRPGTFQT